MTVVVDHPTRRVLWLAEGRSKTTLAKFFALLGPQGVSDGLCKEILLS